MERRLCSGQVAFAIVLTAHRDEVQRTSRVRFDTQRRAEVCQTDAEVGRSELCPLVIAPRDSPRAGVGDRRYGN